MCAHMNIYLSNYHVEAYLGRNLDTSIVGFYSFYIFLLPTINTSRFHIL